MMPKAPLEEGVSNWNAGSGTVHSPAAFLGMLVARSFALAAGVGLMFLLAAALLSGR